MNKIERTINKILRKKGYAIIKLKEGLTRDSTKFAKKYFGNKKLNIAEIGVFEGTNANNLLKELNINKIYLIDPYEIKLWEDYSDAIINAEKKAHRLLKHYKNKIIWIKNSSEKAISRIKENLDFVYIDGNHQYEYVKKDIESYWRILKKGGILAGNDTQIPDVSRAFWEFVIKNKLNKKKFYYTDEDWWILKN